MNVITETLNWIFIDCLLMFKHIEVTQHTIHLTLIFSCRAKKNDTKTKSKNKTKKKDEKR